MKKKLCIWVSAFFLSVFLTGCCISHDFEDATCSEPQTCSKCGKTQGEALEHEWMDATCSEPKTCKLCGETKGEALGHQWEEGDCENPTKCKVCNEIKEEAKGHQYSEATCQAPKICSVCGKTDGEKIQHDWISTTCDQPEYCSMCGTSSGEISEHSWKGYPTTCEKCGKVRENGLEDRVLFWNGCGFTLPETFWQATNMNETNAAYTNGTDTITLVVRRDFDSKINDQCIEYYRNAVGNFYTLVDEGERTFGDYTFYIYEVKYQEAYEGYCILFFADRTYAYMESITNQPEGFEQRFEEIINTFYCYE